MTIIAQDGLPNWMREQLIQLGKLQVARVYDGLVAARWPLERVFSESEALAALQPLGIGRRALREALSTHAFKHLEGRRDTGGRPARLYQARDIIDLMQQFYIGPQVPQSQVIKHGAMETDRLQRGDLAYGRYRQALHREVIRRRQGMETARRWLAERLNVCARTLRRWEYKLRIVTQQSLEYHVLERSAIAELPSELPNHRPMWLQAFGRRWRATQHTAEFLLNQTADVMIVRQRPNKYFLVGV